MLSCKTLLPIFFSTAQIKGGMNDCIIAIQAENTL